MLFFFTTLYQSTLQSNDEIRQIYKTSVTVQILMDLTVSFLHSVESKYHDEILGAKAKFEGFFSLKIVTH